MTQPEEVVDLKLVNMMWRRRYISRVPTALVSVFLSQSLTPSCYTLWSFLSSSTTPWFPNHSFLAFGASSRSHGPAADLG